MGVTAAVAAVATTVIAAGAAVEGSDQARRSRHTQEDAIRDAKARQAKFDAIPLPDADEIARARRHRNATYGTTGRTATVLTEGLGG